MKVDVQFNLVGDKMPADHGWSLYSAVLRLVPKVHESEEIAIHPVNGRPMNDRTLVLTPKSRLTLRLPAEDIGLMLPLAGKQLVLDSHTVRIGVPQTRALVPAARLYSRLVIIKGFQEPEAFIEAARRQLEEMSVSGKASLVEQPRIEQANRERNGGTHSVYLRRTIRIHDKEIVGFAVGVEDLAPTDSIRLQEQGLGGRRKFGCGVFIPHRKSL